MSGDRGGRGQQSEGSTECYACSETIQDGDWVIPLDTYEARYRDNTLVLNADNELETIIHAECLRNVRKDDNIEREGDE